MVETWHCELCFPNAKQVCELGSCCSLIYDDGHFYLLGGQGHNGHELHRFSKKPIPDPDPECYNESLAAESDQWMSDADDFREEFNLSVETAYWFLTKCNKELGWEGYVFHYWFYDYIGKKIQEWENV